MNLKTAIPLSVAMVLGLVAAILGNKIVNSKPKQVTQQGVELVDVVAASRDIAPGTSLVATDFVVARVEPKAAASIAFRDPSLLVDRVAKVGIVPGQILIEPMLAPVGAQAGLQGIIRNGFRAITIEVNEFTGLSGFLKPGNRIDLLGRVPATNGQGQMTVTVVQNIEILATGDRLVAPPEGAPKQPDGQPAPMTRSVTLLVTPDQAEKIDLATTSGQPRLVLRSATDKQMEVTRGTTMDQLRGNSFASNTREADPVKQAINPGVDPFADNQKVSAGLPKPTTVRSVTVIRGGVESQVQVDLPKSSADTKLTGGSDLAGPLN